MQELVELERRIAAALDRIGRGIEGLAPIATPETAPPEPAAPAADPAEIAALREALEEERFINAQLSEKLRAARDKAATGQTQALLAAKVERMTRQLDVQGLELQRMRKTVVQLRETLRALREAVSGAMPDAALINRALLAETEALRATRLTELSLLDEILDELEPLIPETGEDA